MANTTHPKSNPSIFNDVIGPVMRGPSSSHTAGAYRIGRIACDLAGTAIRAVRITFDPSGSYAPTCTALGVDKAFAAAILGWEMTDARYGDGIRAVAETGVDLRFDEEPLEFDDHPNAVRIQIDCVDGQSLEVWAKSTGGGIIEFTRIDQQPVHFEGRAWTTVVSCDPSARPEVTKLLGATAGADDPTAPMIVAETPSRPTEQTLQNIRSLSGVTRTVVAAPVLLAQPGTPLFTSAAELLSLAQSPSGGSSIAKLAIEYECTLLGMTKDACRREMERRLDVMIGSVDLGLDDESVDMPLVDPSAARILNAERRGLLPLGGVLTRAGARAMAAMHTCNSKGVVCAAPTGGSAGVLPGVLVTLELDMEIPRDRLVDAAFVAGAVGLIMARRATFAAEEAGCQVEIGFAGAMAAAALIETFGGTAEQALNGAAITLQNTSGMVCDTVGGGCEIPCHTRNAAAASGAFLTADLILGGYDNPIPLDESIDASYEAGRAIPAELRCTSRGGLAITRSAEALITSRESHS